MKRVTALFLALLMLTQAFSALALQKSANIPMDTLNYVESAAALNGKLYLAGYDSVHEWDGETGELTRLAIAQETDMGDSAYPYLVARDDALYGIDLSAGTLTELVITGAEIKKGASTPFDNKNLLATQDGFTNPFQILTAVLLGNKLYLLTTTEDESYYARSLHEIDLQTGKCATLLSGTNLNAMCGYKDGNLLFKVLDLRRYNMSGQNEADLPAFTVYDTTQRKWAQTILSLEDDSAIGMAYDEKTDMLYMVSDGQLFSQAAMGALQPIGYINYISNESANDSVKAILIGSSQYVLIDNTGVFIRPTDSNDRINDVFRITGTSFSQLGKTGYQAFVKAHPDISISIVDDVFFRSGDAIYQDFFTATAGDVYAVDDVDMLAALVKKGYCMDLSASSKLTQAVAKMYPHMTKELYKDGKLYAVPFSISFKGIIGYSPSLFEKIGVAKDDVPNTLMEFMDFMVDWVNIYANAYPDLDLFRYNDQPVRNMMLELILSQQLAFCRKKDIPLTYDTPEMRILLNKLAEVTPIIATLDPDEDETGAEWSEDAPLVALIEPYYFVFNHYRGANEDYEPMHLGFADDIPMQTIASMNMLMVNPNTTHPELAIALLESLVDNMEAQSAIMLFENRNEPVEDPNYPQNKQLQDEFFASLNEALAKETDELMIMQLQETIEDNKGWYDSLEKNRYAISAEAIAFYRSIASSVYPAGFSTSIIWQTESLRDLRTRYIDNQVTAEQFVNETEKILKMIYLENQ